MLLASILALVSLTNSDIKPSLLKEFKSHEACMVEADRRNRTDTDLRKRVAREESIEYVCLKVVRSRV